MKTPEEIMEAFKCCERDVLDPCSGCPYEREYAEDWKCALSNDALACIQQLEAQIPRWISVDERLPKFVSEGYNYKITETVLAVDSTGFSYAGYFKVYNYDGSRAFYGVDVDVFECDTYSVTHWMPLPEPPKETTT